MRSVFGLALVATIARLAMRLHQYRRLFLDDAFLLFACTCLCAETGLVHALLPASYMVEGLRVNSHTTAFGPQNLDNLSWYLKIVYSFLALSWATIFAVKLSFLVFFRNLIRRLPRMNAYWRFVVATTLLVFAFNFCAGFIACPHLGLAARE